ncbi:MAG: hypothetical protein MUF28_14020 [Ignavibacterium sp.]|nr:hypothetical protein [Ignavibacterium sp.]
MDDLFQYLIYGIIIFSFLSSFFKKKEPPKQSPLPRTKQPDSVSSPKQQTDVERVAASQKQDEYDILRELENMFKGEINLPPKQSPQQTQYEEYTEHKIEDKNLETISDRRTLRNVDQNPSIEFKQSVEERNYIEPKGTVEQYKWTKKKSKIDPKIEASAKEFEKVLTGPRNQRAAITDFNRKLKNPRTVREYILFSEILGKPKALRR